jgi:hypothetical protein
MEKNCGERMSFLTWLSQWYFHMLLALAFIGISKNSDLRDFGSLGTREACAWASPSLVHFRESNYWNVHYREAPLAEQLLTLIIK